MQMLKEARKNLITQFESGVFRRSIYPKHKGTFLEGEAKIREQSQSHPELQGDFFLPSESLREIGLTIQSVNANLVPMLDSSDVSVWKKRFKAPEGVVFCGRTQDSERYYNLYRIEFASVLYGLRAIRETIRFRLMEARRTKEIKTCIEPITLQDLAELTMEEILQGRKAVTKATNQA